MDNVRKETHELASENRRSSETKRPIVLSHTKIRRPRLTARERTPQKNQATEMKALLIKGAKFRADTGVALIRHVDGGILPYVKTTSLRLDAKLATSAFFDTQMGRPAKKSKKGGAMESVVLLKESTQLVGSCTIRESLFYGKRKNGIESHRQIFQGHVAPQIWGTNPSRGVMKTS